ncbi:MAG TPA: acyltransferase [Elusimicrobiota bacterium]|nr:acyltransferase [Elusimicrobiota bacterium]
MSDDKSREGAIDVLRGVSIAAVLFYHFELADPVSRFGVYGVALFFMISGYCMLPSVRGSASLGDFLAKRYARLLPALWICAVITTAVERSFPLARPDRIHGYMDMAKTMVFLPAVNLPTFLPRLWGGPVNHYAFVDGAYWSLLVEFKFYWLIGLAYFALRRFNPFWVIYAVSWAGNALLGRFGGPGYWTDFFPYLPLFLLGMAGWEIRHGNPGRGGWQWLAALGALAAVPWMGGEKAPSLPMDGLSVGFGFLCGVLLVFGAMADQYWREPIGTRSMGRWWVALGAISYPLYLLHQDIGYVLFALFRWGETPGGRALLAVPLILGAMGVHFLMENRFRPSLRKKLRPVFDRVLAPVGLGPRV